MIPVKFKDQNIIFQKPSNMPEDAPCGDLPAKRTKNGNYAATEAVFELSDDEIALVIKSKRIRFGAFGHSLPPLYLVVEEEGNEFVEPEPEITITDKEGKRISSKDTVKIISNP